MFASCFCQYLDRTHQNTLQLSLYTDLQNVGIRRLKHAVPYNKKDATFNPSYFPTLLLCNFQKLKALANSKAPSESPCTQSVSASSGNSPPQSVGMCPEVRHC